MAVSSIGSIPQSAYTPQTSPLPTDSGTSANTTATTVTPTTAAATSAQSTGTGKPDLDAPAAPPSPDSNIKINPDGTTGPLHKHNPSTRSVHA